KPPRCWAFRRQRRIATGLTHGRGSTAKWPATPNWKASPDFFGFRWGRYAPNGALPHEGPRRHRARRSRKMDEASIFLEALQKPAPADRAAYLDGACAGNADLRRSVEMLLKAHARAGDFLHNPPADVGPTVDPTIAERPGTAIGPYRLLQP